MTLIVIDEPYEDGEGVKKIKDLLNSLNPKRLDSTIDPVIIISKSYVAE